MIVARFAVPAFIIALAGCEKAVAPPAKLDTGAEAVARSFFEALARENWPAAYELLDAESRTWCSADHFANLGQSYRAQINFSPSDVSVLVTENGEQASAIAHYHGTVNNSMKSFKDGTSLRKIAGAWAVVLRRNFGQKAP